MHATIEYDEPRRRTQLILDGHPFPPDPEPYGRDGVQRTAQMYAFAGFDITLRVHR